MFSRSNNLRFKCANSEPGVCHIECQYKSVAESRCSGKDWLVVCTSIFLPNWREIQYYAVGLIDTDQHNDVCINHASFLAYYNLQIDSYIIFKSQTDFFDGAHKHTFIQSLHGSIDSLFL